MRACTEKRLRATTLDVALTLFPAARVIACLASAIASAVRRDEAAPKSTDPRRPSRSSLGTRSAVRSRLPCNSASGEAGLRDATSASFSSD